MLKLAPKMQGIDKLQIKMQECFQERFAYHHSIRVCVHRIFREEVFLGSECMVAKKN